MPNVFTVVAPHDFAMPHGKSHPLGGPQFAFDVASPGRTEVYFKPWVHVGDVSDLWGHVTSIVHNGGPSDSRKIRSASGDGAFESDFSVSVDLVCRRDSQWVTAGRVKYQHLSGVAVAQDAWLPGGAHTLLGLVNGDSNGPGEWWRVPADGGPPQSRYWTGPHTHWEGSHFNGYTINWFSNGHYGHYYWSI